MSEHGTRLRYRTGCKCSACRQAAAAYAALRAAANPLTAEHQRKGQLDYQRRYPEKHRAHQAVYRAKKRGDLIPAEVCERCGQFTPTEASHSDYAQPLLVEWLCRPCHLRKDLGFVY